MSDSVNWLADYCQQITSLYCYGSIIPSGLERNQRKRNPHQRWVTRAQSFCFKICFWIAAIKNLSGIKLIREEEALACVSLARVKRHTKHFSTDTQTKTTGKHAIVSVKRHRHGKRNVSVGVYASWIRFKFEFLHIIHSIFHQQHMRTFINICWY